MSVSIDSTDLEALMSLATDVQKLSEKHGKTTDTLQEIATELASKTGELVAWN